MTPTEPLTQTHVRLRAGVSLVGATEAALAAYAAVSVLAAIIGGAIVAHIPQEALDAIRAALS